MSYNPLERITMRKSHTTFILTLVLFLAILQTGCLPPDMVAGQADLSLPEANEEQPEQIQITPLPTRLVYQPGDLVDYVAQPGDTLPAVAAHFNTTVKEIRAANAFIPEDATTMPPGMPMKIPIYYQALWGSPAQIIPDSHYVNGPAASGFDTKAFVAAQPGWLKNYTDYVADQNRSGAEIVDFVAAYYSISPRLLLSLLEYQLGALTKDQPPANLSEYPLGQVGVSYRGLYRQLTWAANTLNNGYYAWRKGDLREITLQGGKLMRPDPWQNAASVALQYYFSRHASPDAYEVAVSPAGFAATFNSIFGDPWTAEPHIQGSLRQPFLRLPFEPGKSWAYTGGPHNAWGENAPLSAIDFAPPSVVGGCTETEEYATAMADGKIVRVDTGVAVLDLDQDGDERTGWVIFYLHLDRKDFIQVGSTVVAGQPIGHPSCEGGRSTGTHIHIARKYNGEWMIADGVLAFNLEGWVVQNGREPYQGYLTRQGRTISACVCSDQASQLKAEFR